MTAHADGSAGRGAGAARAVENDPRLREALVATAVRPVWVALGVASVPFLLGIDLPLWAQYLPLVASAVVLGLPHGAVDHLVAARVGATTTGRSVLAAVAVYLAFGLAYLAVWYVAPAVAAVGFVAITWLHWGQGDVYLLDAITAGAYPRSIPHRAVVLLSRGALPMAVPLLAFPGQYRRVVENFVTPFGGDAGSVAILFVPGARAAVGAAVVTLGLLSVGRGLVDRSEGLSVATDRGAVVDAVETVLLWAYFLVVPPILAVGLYFCLWHAGRHVARLLLLDDRGAEAVRDLDVPRALGRFARDAAPLTAVSLVLIAALALAVPRAPSDLGEGVALYLVGIAVLTLPHVVVVTWLDHVQGIWRPGGWE